MSKNMWINTLLIISVVILMVWPLVFAAKGAEFNGSDIQASKAISQLQPGFKPWFHSLWAPPGSEIESLFFALQASLGTGFIAFFFGYKMGQQKSKSSQSPSSQSQV